MLAFTAHCSLYLLTSTAAWQTVAEVVAEGLNIRYNSIVTAIQWEGSGATVCTADGHHFSADAVIVTVSLGVLKVTSPQFSFLPAQRRQRILSRLGEGYGFLPATGNSCAWCQAFISSKKGNGGQRRIRQLRKPCHWRQQEHGQG